MKAYGGSCPRFSRLRRICIPHRSGSPEAVRCGCQKSPERLKTAHNMYIIMWYIFSDTKH